MLKKIGFWGLIALGVAGLIIINIQYAFSDPSKYVAPLSLLFLAAVLKKISSNPTNSDQN